MTKTSLRKKIVRSDKAVVKMLYEENKNLKKMTCVHFIVLCHRHCTGVHFKYFLKINRELLIY